MLVSPKGRQVVITGSRSFSDRGAIERTLVQLPPYSVVISGGARGADSLAHEVAKELGFRTQVMEADWDRYGHSAGFRRNLEMLDTDPHFVIAFWDGRSSGTAHTIEHAKERGIPVHLVKSRSNSKESS